MKQDAFHKEHLIKKSENLSGWYNNIILKTKLGDYGPVKGTMVFRPYGYAIWERIQQEFDRVIKADGVQNAYFPLFIPERLLKKEKEHVEGFAPEVAVVTYAGGKELKEKIVVRPTSETIMYEMFAKWIQSWRDLPLLINQWSNVVRWELRTHLFLRTSEFLWQEGHTVHSTKQEAIHQTLKSLNHYIDLYRLRYAVAGIAGKKSETEKFAGAVTTYTYEMLMPDGKALQGCTSHDLGQNFAKPFHIEFLDKDGTKQIPWQTSWGLSTRSIGALVMAHGDDHGLMIPPSLAPTQAVIVPILKDKTPSADFQQRIAKIAQSLSSLRTETDMRAEYSAGWKFNEWEMKGVPLRIEIGERELEANTATLVARDTGEKRQVPLANLEKEARNTLETIQKNLLARSEEFLKTNTHEIPDYKEFKEALKKKRGFLRAFWCENPSCEASIKKETKATTRCLPLDAKEEKGECVYCKKPAVHRWIFAQAY